MIIYNDIDSIQSLTIEKTIEIAIKNWAFPLKVVIFHSYSSLPEGATWDETNAMNFIVAEALCV